MLVAFIPLACTTFSFQLLELHNLNLRLCRLTAKVYLGNSCIGV